VRTAASDPVAESLAEFLAIGGRLMLLKSRRLLPSVVEDAATEDSPGRELVDMLEEHQRYREAVEMLGTIDRSGLRSFGASAPAAVDLEPPQGLPDTVTLELLSKLVREALARADTRTERHPEVALQRDPITVRDKIEELQGRLQGGWRVSFRDWIAESRTRVEVIVTFMAILELYKSRAIEMQQDDAYGDILVVEKAVVRDGVAGDVSVSTPDV
jgi:segregation and condensation protein A